MQMSVYTAGAIAAQQVTMADGISPIIRTVLTPEEARSLPRGTVVGDVHGGLTFTDAVAAVLESRSQRGWYEAQGSDGNRWTVIVLNR